MEPATSPARRILITAGPTREPIDAVRYIGNRSSGRMGLALVAAAVEAGHDVTLLLGPVDLPVPSAKRLRVYRFESSAELQQLLEAHFRDCDVLVMAAAVADYRPAQVHEGKLARSSDPAAQLTLHLQPTPDLVATAAALRRPGQRIVAFALEPAESLEARARAKLQRKAVDAIVANPLGTMESSDVTPLWLTPTDRAAPGRMSKPAFARWLIARLAQL